MLQWRKLKIVFMGLALLLGMGGLLSVHGAELHLQNVTVIKYGLSPGATSFAPDQTINTGQTINNLPVYDNTGKELHPLAKIQYQIVPVVATGSAEIKLADQRSYRQVGSPTVMTTDAQGTASVRLPDGYYILREMANVKQGLVTPQAPVLIKLPAWDTASDSYLDTLYIYPKSSIAASRASAGGQMTSKQPATAGHSKVAGGASVSVSKETPIKQATSKDTANLVDHLGRGKSSTGWLGNVLPDTGDLQTIAGILGCLILGATLMIILIKRRRRDEDERTTD